MTIGTNALVVYEPGDVKLEEVETLVENPENDRLQALLDQHASLREKVEAVSTIAHDRLYCDALVYFLQGNCSRGQVGASIIAEQLFQREGAMKALNAAFWRQALELTDVYQVMSQERRERWNEDIYAMNVPEFEPSTVRETVRELLLARNRFFAEKVDGIFRALSGKHITNSPAGFRERMIVDYVLCSGIVNRNRCGIIGDLRCVVAKFMGREEPSWNTAQSLIDAAGRRLGEWMDVDGGAFRVKVFKKGTAHIELHPDLAWRLNALLASLYPRAIPSEHRRQPRVRSSPIKKPLPFSVIHILAQVRRYAGDPRLFQLPFGFRSDTDSAVVVLEALQRLGGVLDSPDGYEMRFEYDATAAIDSVVTSGCLPEDRQ